MVLHEFKHDVALRRVGVEALVALLIVFLVQDYLVLALSHCQVVGSPVHTQCVGLQSSRDVTLGQCIGMYGDKEVGLVLVGNVGTGVQRHEDIRLAGVDDLYVRTVLLHQPAKGQCHIQVDGFLLGDFAHRTCIVSAVSGVDDQREALVGSNCGYRHQR